MEGGLLISTDLHKLRFVNFRFSGFWVLICAFLPSVLVGQFQRVDYTARANEIESKRFEAEMTTPKASSRWMSRRFDTQRFSTSQHRYADRKFQSEKIEMFRTRQFETEKLDFETRDVEWFRGKDRQFSESELRVLRNNTLAQFDRKQSVTVDVEPAVDVEKMLDQLSLADLNRFHFGRNHSSEPGLPSQKAGSGGDES